MQARARAAPGRALFDVARFSFDFGSELVVDADAADVGG